MVVTEVGVARGTTSVVGRSRDWQYDSRSPRARVWCILRDSHLSLNHFAQRGEHELSGAPPADGADGIHDHHRRRHERNPTKEDSPKRAVMY